MVASALVVNFIPDRPRAIAEMRRVARAGGVVAGYVWDFAGERGTGSPFIRAMREVGIEGPRVPGAEDSSVEALQSLFKHAGLADVAVRPIEIKVTSNDFDDYWSAQTPVFSPNRRLIAELSEADRTRLKGAVRAIVLPNGGSEIAYPATANAWKAHVA